MRRKAPTDQCQYIIAQTNMGHPGADGNHSAGAFGTERTRIAGIHSEHVEDVFEI